MNPLPPPRVQCLQGYLLRPFGLLPFGLTQHGFIMLCNQAFATACAAGDLDFLAGHVVRIELRDAGVVLGVSLHERRLIAVEAGQSAAVRISGDAHAFLLLASRREDPDSLFFQRRLRIEGATELGLHLKNFLDAWEPPPAVRALQRFTAALLERLPS